MTAHHDHAGHSHGAPRAANRKRLLVVLALASVYCVAEVVGGLLTNSLALLADAGHMLSDVAALALSVFAIWIAERPPTPQRSYGYYRAEILAALVNGATLVAISIYVFIEAYQRLRAPPDVQGVAMMAIATGGLLVNVIGLVILNAGRKESLNVRGAWLHVLTDALGSVGAIVGGLLIWRFDWQWADPVVSVFICVLVLYSSWNLLREAVAVLMEGAPAGIDVDDVRSAIAGVSGVTAVHDLHVWAISSGMVALSAHVTAPALPAGHVIRATTAVLRERFGIEHATLQVESADLDERDMHA